MRYSIRQYAAALADAIDGKSAAKRKEAARNFLGILSRQRTMARLPAIFRELERVWLARQGITKVEVETPDGLARQVKSEIEHAIKGKTLIQAKENPELLAGMRVLIDDEVLVDATAKRRMGLLFREAI